MVAFIDRIDLMALDSAKMLRHPGQMVVLKGWLVHDLVLHGQGTYGIVADLGSARIGRMTQLCLWVLTMDKTADWAVLPTPTR